MGRDRAAVLGALAVLAVLWVTFGLVLEPEKEGSCTTGLYPGTYADVLIPAHVAAYLVLASLIAWWRPPGRATRAGLAATTVLVLVSLVWPPPAVVLGVVGSSSPSPPGSRRLPASRSSSAEGRATARTLRTAWCGRRCWSACPPR